MFNPHPERSQIECVVKAPGSGVTMITEVDGQSRKSLTAKLHGLKPGTEVEDIDVNCSRLVEG